MRRREILFFTIMMAIPVVFLELSLQIYYRATSGEYLIRRMVIPMFSADEHRYYKNQPNLSYRHRTNEYDVTYYTNRQGFRTDSLRQQISLKKSATTYRVLFLGPSFAFGWANNYEDSYVSVIGKSITAPGKDVEVMNLGTPAQPISYQLCWLEEMGHKFKPDMIIQTIYGNVDGFDTECKEPSKPPFVRNGYLYRSEPTLREKLFEKAKNSAIVFYGWNIYQSLLPEKDNNIGLGLDLYEKPELVSDKINSVKAESYKKYIQFVKKAVSPDIPVVFLYVPVSYAVRPADARRWKHRMGKDPYVYRREAKEMETLLSKHEIPFVNPTDELVIRDKETRMYYWLDIHFTPAGNRALAEKAIPVVQALILQSDTDASPENNLSRVR